MISGKPIYKMNIVILIICMTPVALGFLYVFLCGVNVPYWDQFDGTVPLFGKLWSGTLTFTDLWARHNEHIIFFPRLLMLALGGLTRYNTLAEMYASEMLLCISCLIFFLAAKKQFGFGLSTVPLWMAPVSFMTFSLVQKENMLWGFQIAFVLAQTAAVIACYFLYLLTGTSRTKSRFIYFFLAAVFASISSFSSSMGICVWIAGCSLLLVSSLDKINKTKYLSVFAIIGGIHWHIYSHHYKTLAHHPSPLFLLHHPFSFIEYIIACHGGALIGKKWICIVIGVFIAGMVLLSGISLYKNKRAACNSFWLSIIIFSVLSVVSIAVGRAGFGVGQALSSRYATFSMLLVIGLYTILMDLRISGKSNFNVPFVGYFGIIILAGIAFSDCSGFLHGINARREGKENAFILYTYPSQPDEFLKRLYPDADRLKNCAGILKRIEFNVFSPNALSRKYPEISALVERPAMAAINIGITDEKTINAGGDTFVVITGYAYPEKTREAIGGVYLDVDGKIFPAYYGALGKADRPYFSTRQFPRPNFNRAISVRSLGKGDHILSVKILSKDRKSFYAAAGKFPFIL